ncbi:CTP synthase (glutamine hydrolyzing) [Candidatus Pacearchaeota archaeon]|nr:CTP synthase (glutamine hydrolyzing) [Candidatus Pacearchaeota archaeon]
MTKFIVVAGGVISGVGKGVATASIGRILKEYGFSVTAVKIDPYINCDAGTLRPTEHGEVWVTNDGGEIDQDLGNYERFLEQAIPKKNNITTGQIYRTLIEKERKGDFLGETVQFIPHVTDEIKNRVKEASSGFDIALVELGGTVGDYENIPFLFAMKSLEKEIGKENVAYILVTYLPIPSHIEEMKTKPTQLSVKLLQENGILPDFILCRGKKALDEVRKKKIETYANIDSEHVISMPDVTGEGTPNTLYIIPLLLEKEKLGEKILNTLNLERKKEPDFTAWKKAVDNIISPEKEIDIAIVGKYLDIGDYKLVDSYISINEALKHASAKNNVRINISWIDSKELERTDEKILEKFRGIIIPGGFGSIGIEGKIKAIKFCRENNIPFLGLCFGLQLAVVEFARNVCNLENANSTEINPATRFPVIDILPEQKSVSEKGATMRLGAYKAILKDDTLTKQLYNSNEIYERHRHRYEVNPEFHKILQENGLIFSGTSENERLVEFIELPEHKFFIATQAHPEFNSSLLKPSPLFDGFVKACIGS